MAVVNPTQSVIYLLKNACLHQVKTHKKLVIYEKLRLFVVINISEICVINGHNLSLKINHYFHHTSHT